MSNFKLVKAETAKLRNQIKNPSLEASVNNWTASGGTFTRSTDWSYEGAYSGKFVAGATTQNVKSNGVNVSNGQSIALSLVTYRASSTPTGTVTIYDATNGAVRATSSIAATADPELHELLWTNSTGGTVSVELRINNTTADSASVLYFDAGMLTYTTYNVLWFDGDRPGCKWAGSRHESVSDMLPFSVSGGRVRDFETDYSFKVTGAPGAGNAPIITNYLPYAIVPGGSYQNSGIGVRDWSLTGWIQEGTHEEWQTARKTLLQELNPNRFGDGQPVLIRYTGTSTRQIEAYFNGGLETPQPQYRAENIAPRFVSTDPYWRSPNRRATVVNTETSATMELVIAKIDGLWTVLGPPNAAGTYTNITAIAVSPDGKVYVGGDFLNFDNQATADYLTYYDKITQTWGTVAALNGSVLSMAFDAAGVLYFGGTFTNAGGVAAADYLAQWDGSSVTAVGTPNTGTASIGSIDALAFDGQGRLWIGGNFLNIGDVGAADRLAYWDGTSYYALSTGANAIVRALAYDATGDRMYIGGEFTTLGGTSIVKVGYWDWTSPNFYAMGSGTTGGSNVVYALAVDAVGGVYVGGTFTTFNGVDCLSVGYWNGTTAQALAGGIDGTGVTPVVLTIAIAPTGEVWIGGQFDLVNGIVPVDMLTVWNGSTFYSPPVDMPGTAFVNALTFDPSTGDDADVYIGTTATGAVKYSNTTTVINSGTEKANPVFYIKRTGGTQAKLISIENTTTRKKVIFNYALRNGEELKIDLRPGKKRITSSIKTLSGQGSNTLNVGSDLSDFYMIPGTNVLAVYMSTAGSPTVPATVELDELFVSFD